MNGLPPQAPPLDLLDVLRDSYPGWEIYCHTTGSGAEQWTAARRAKATERSQRAGILQRIESESGQLLAETLAEQLVLIHANAAYRWPTP